MKLRIFTAVLASFFALGGVESDSIVSKLGSFIHSNLKSSLIKVSGTRALSLDVIQARFPQEKNNIELAFDNHEVVETLRLHPLIQNASFERCSVFAWQCFELVITERAARFVASMSEGAQILGSDGRSISPIKNELLGAGLQSTGVAIPALQQLFPPGRNTIPLVMGLDQFASSPDTLQQGYRFTSSLLDTLEGQHQHPVAVLTYRSSHVLEVKFSDFAPVVTLQIPNTDIEMIREQISTQLLRLAAVREAVAENIQFAQMIDLGFSNQAVVRLAQPISYIEEEEELEKPAKGRKPQTRGKLPAKGIRVSRH